jgi:hypothetical protein
MNIKLIEIVNAQPALVAIINTADGPRKFKRAQLARRIGRLVAQLEPHLKQYEELRQGIFAQHGKLNEDKTLWEFAPEQIESVNAQLLALGSDEIAIDHIPIPDEWLDAEGIELTVPEAAALAVFMEAE